MVKKHYISRLIPSGYLLGNTSRRGEENVTTWYNVRTAKIVGFGSSNPCPGKRDIEYMLVRLDKQGLPLPETHLQRGKIYDAIERKLLRDIENYRKTLEEVSQERVQTSRLF